MDWTLLPERQRQQQNAIWELVQTEVAYLRTLKVITDVSLIRSIVAIYFCLRPSSSIRLCENDGGLFWWTMVLYTTSTNINAAFSRY